MRTALAVVLALAAPAAAAPLDRAETLTVMRVDDDGHARCEAWRVDPAKHQLIGKDATRTYSTSADRVELDTLTDDSGTRSCTLSWPAHDHPEALVVDGASWFRDPKACTAAIAKHLAVATDLRDCETSPIPTPKQLAWSRTRFELLMARGGAVFTNTGKTCEAVRVRDDRTAPPFGGADGRGSPAVERQRAGDGQLAASFVSVYEDATQLTVTAIPFAMSPGDDLLDRFAAVSTTTYKQDPELGAGSYDCPCAERVPLQLAAESFDLEGAFYFTRARCTAANAGAAARLAWWPSADKRWDW